MAHKQSRDKPSRQIIAEHCPLWALTEPDESLPDVFTAADVRKEAWTVINALADALVAEGNTLPPSADDVYGILKHE